MEVIFGMQINVRESASWYYPFYGSGQTFEILKIGSWQYFCNALRKIVATAFLVLLRGKFLRNFYSFCEL